MRILLTGASSFTGFWFARALAAAGHEVVAPLRDRPQDDGLRARRIASLAAAVTLHFDCPFGGDGFLALIRQGRWDLLCHHAATVADYRSKAFDVAAALDANTQALPAVLETMQARGLRGVVLTGSVFEPNEGAGTAPLRAVSPYGLSKGFTAGLVEYWCGALGIGMTKFVIANPIGPWEEPRFVHYLAEQWRRGAAPEVRTPFYVRDNIHVDLLAAIYADHCERLAAGRAASRVTPSLYAETQGAFAQRLATAFSDILGRPFPLRFAASQAFDEPAVRVGTDPARLLRPDWNEIAAWAQLAAFYFNPRRETIID